MQEMRFTNLYADPASSIAYSHLAAFTYPWEALGVLGEIILAIGATLPTEAYTRVEETVWIAKEASVAPTASIAGPCIICAGAEVRHCAFLRGNTLVGRSSVVGNSTELKNCILFDRVQVPHYNYVGDSILGFGVHLGAGAITSNVKSDKTPVCICKGEERLRTGCKKMGAMLGDHVEIGCGTVLNPGTVIGRESTVYPLCSVRGFLPPRHIFKRADTVVPKRESR